MMAEPGMKQISSADPAPGANQVHMQLYSRPITLVNLA